MKKGKSCLCLLLSVSIFLMGCAGRQANPIATYLPGDENRSCMGLRAEIAILDSQMRQLSPKTDKVGTNVIWAIAGIFLIVPFFFMDFKDAEKIEYDAYRARKIRLMVYAAEKGCDFGSREMFLSSLKNPKKK